MTDNFVFCSIQIRMGLEHWRSLKQLMDTLESQGHLDAVYIFNQLKMKKAFMFTAMPKKVSLVYLSTGHYR